MLEHPPRTSWARRKPRCTARLLDRRERGPRVEAGAGTTIAAPYTAQTRLPSTQPKQW